MTPHVLIGLPVYNGWIRDEVSFFLSQVPRERVLIQRHKPTDIARNALVMEARRRKADVLFMIDADADPAPGTFDALLEVALAEPCVVAVPYCSSGGQVCVFVPPEPTTDGKIMLSAVPDESPITIADAVSRTGLHRVTNVGTHCVAYNVAAFECIPPPWFEFTTDPTRSMMLETEDCVGHRRLRLAGIPLYCHFDFWAGHWKERRLGKPEVLTPKKLAFLSANVLPLG